MTGSWQDVATQMKLLTELLNVVCFATSILFELVLQYWSISLEKLLDSMDSVGVLFRALEGLEGCEVLLARAVKLWDGKLWKLILVSEGDAGLRVRVRVMTKRISCLGGKAGLAVSGGDFRAN
jgi:hypothetical protein